METKTIKVTFWGADYDMVSIKKTLCLAGVPFSETSQFIETTLDSEHYTYLSESCRIDHEPHTFSEPQKPEIKPAAEEKQTRKFPKVAHKKFGDVLNIVNANEAVYLAGPAGTGKSVICKQVADALGLPFYSSSSITQEYKVTGFIDANGKFQDTQFYAALVNGGVFMLDELDASDPAVLVLLNEAIANGYFDFPNGKVTAHPNFRIIAAGNTVGTGADMQYTGRTVLDAATLDRFTLIHIDYDKNVELLIAGGTPKIKQKWELLEPTKKVNPEAIVEFTTDFREAVKKCGINFTCSYRSTKRLRKFTEIWGETYKAVNYAVVRSLEKDDLKMISEQLKSKDNVYTKALLDNIR